MASMRSGESKLPVGFDGELIKIAAVLLGYGDFATNLLLKFLLSAICHYTDINSTHQSDFITILALQIQYIHSGFDFQRL